MTREEAINEIRSWNFLNGKEKEAIQTLVPELREKEDERIRKEICKFISDTVGHDFYGYGISKEEALAYLEKQREQKPAEWSEEDEKMIDDICFQLDGYPEADVCEMKSWLKSLRPQPRWKPSEEQIYSLGTVVKGYNECTVGSVGYHLKEMYEQLKKLM